MQVVVATRRGGPEVLELQQKPQPKAGPDQILIKVISAGINFADALSVSGYYATAPQPPWTPGHEVAGHDVDSGRPVLAYVPSGGYAEYVVAKRAFAFDCDGLDLKKAGGWFLVSVAALCSLRDAARLRIGETVLITAGAGGLGSAAIQIAKMLGAGRIIAVASTPEKRAFAIQHGANEALAYEDPVPPIDVFFDSVGSAEGYERRLEAVRQFGRVVLMGASSGKAPEVPNFEVLRARNIGIFPFSWGVLRRDAPDRAADAAREVVHMIREGHVRPPIWRSMPLQDVAAAHSLLLNRRTMGKVVLVS